MEGVGETFCGRKVRGGVVRGRQLRMRERQLGKDDERQAMERGRE